MKHNILLVVILLLSPFAYSQVISTQDVQKEIDRIDAFDGELDGIISLSNYLQSNKATQIFIQIPTQIIQKLSAEEKGITYSRRVLKGLHDVLSKVSPSDYFQLSYYEKLMVLAKELVFNKDHNLVLNKLKSEAKIALNLAELIKNHPNAKSFWLYTIQFYPTEVLSKFIQLYNEPYALEILEAVALDAPTVMKEYFGSNHLNARILKQSTKDEINTLFAIFKQHGTASKAYILLNEIINGNLTILQAHKIGANNQQLFDKLIQIRKNERIYGNYSVEKEIEALCMEKVVEINLRHEENDAVRFEPINDKSAEEIYFYMVYTPEEIFTSSFLGMYNRMMAKNSFSSGYDFLKSMHFTKFRIFLKQCAGYGKLDDFLATMNAEQKASLIHLLCQNLDKTGGNLGPAVDVADFYASLYRQDLKVLLKNTIEKNLIDRASNEDLNGMKLYGLLFKLMGGEPETYVWQFDFELPLLDRITTKDLFKDGLHIQQHFFYDDEDGLTAFTNFLSHFGADWKREDKGNFLILSTGPQNQRIQMYIVKPANEIEAREELKNLFDKNRRFPDLIVHRGHSYYVENTIAHMTNHTKIAILGSCGGFQNIAQAMENALDVHIVSTKQIGTLLVNNALIIETIETIKKGKDIVWPELWKRVRNRVGGNPRFNDYVPPHLNLGARFIKAYNTISEN